MRTAQILPGIHLIVGDTYESSSMAFVRGQEVLLVDALGSTTDAERLLDYVTNILGKRVRMIISTHYFSDHMAGLRLFPEADILAHENYRQTAEVEEFVSEEERGFFVEPTILVSNRLTMRWGDYTLRIFHNPGHTPSTLGIEVPEADLLFTGDTLVGNIVYLRYGNPEGMRTALGRLRKTRASRVISSHGVPRPRRSIDFASTYLGRLGRLAERAFESSNPARLLDTPLENCIDPAAGVTDFEKIFHRRNLETILEKRFFADAPVEASA